MTQTTIDARGVRHAVRLFGHPGELALDVGSYIGAALHRRDPAIVIATAAHLAVFDAALADAGIDPRGARSSGLLTTLDAAETLSTFSVDGSIDAAAFDAAIGELVRLARRRGGRPVAYGEMVAVLWDSGDVVAALELEELWNDLLEAEDFSLLCGYPSSIASGTASHAFDEMCSLHSEVVGAPTVVGTSDDGRALRQSQRFGCDLGAPRQARRFAEQALAEGGLPWFADDAALVVSELANNAVLHAKTEFVVTLTARPDSLRVAVRDGSEALPRYDLRPSASASSGRGWTLIRTLADAYGSRVVDGGGKVVWAEIVHPRTP